MTPEKYAEFVKMSSQPEKYGAEYTERDPLFLGAMGLCGEAGEVSEHFKKHLLHAAPLDLEKVKNEMGDVLWYFQLICNNHGFTIAEIMEGNVQKLCDRFGYDSEKWGIKAPQKVSCADCKHYAHDLEEWFCGHPEAMKQACFGLYDYIMRRSGEACGPDGKLFEHRMSGK